MSENNLLPCPFCGGEAELCVHETTRVSWVRCTECEVSNGATSSKAAVQSWNRRAAVTDHDFAMAIHDGNLWGKCSECKERQGYCLDAETIQRQQGHIAELERSLEHYRLEVICYENDVDARDALICDLWTAITWMHGMSDTKRDELRRRIRDMGIDLDGEVEA